MPNDMAHQTVQLTQEFALQNPAQWIALVDLRRGVLAVQVVVSVSKSGHSLSSVLIVVAVPSAIRLMEQLKPNSAQVSTVFQHPTRLC